MVLVKVDLIYVFQGNEDYVGIAARDTVNALKVMVSAVRGVAATTNDNQVCIV